MFLDIAFGIFASLGIGSLFFDTVPYWYVVLGVFFVLLPDIDGIFWILKPSIRKEWYRVHRTYTGYPFLYIPAAIIIYIISGESIAILFSLCVLFHHVHDTFFLGWGVMWLWPFSKRKWKMFPDKDGVITKIPLVSWLPDEEEKFRKWSGGHNDGWVVRYYLRPNFIAYIEYGSLLLSFIVLFNYFLKVY